MLLRVVTQVMPNTRIKQGKKELTLHSNFPDDGHTHRWEKHKQKTNWRYCIKCGLQKYINE